MCELLRTCYSEVIEPAGAHLALRSESMCDSWEDFRQSKLAWSRPCLMAVLGRWLAREGVR